MALLPEDYGSRIFSVSEITEAIKGLLETEFAFVWVEGEISNFRAPLSGHYYMALKDDKAQLRAVMFRPQARHLKFVPEDGMKVIARGKISVYSPRGEYQIMLDYLEPTGVGALAVAFEQLKKKLAALGVFDKEVKRPLPRLPQKVAVITSPTGAAIRDFLKVIARRFANIEITVVPVRVQGEEAASDIVKAIRRVNEELEVDVIVLTRGGGSLEDLWAFNQESVAMAVRESRIPVVSAVGHEIDTTISDLAADFRAPTPSAAAELLVLEKETLKERLKQIEDRLTRGVSLVIRNHRLAVDRLAKRLPDPWKRLNESWMHLDGLHSRLTRLVGRMLREGSERLKLMRRSLLFKSPLDLVARKHERLDLHKRSLASAIGRQIQERQTSLSFLEKRLRDLGPLSTLERGYSITLRLPERSVVKKVREVGEGEKVEVMLSNGELACKVEKVIPRPERDPESGGL